MLGSNITTGKSAGELWQFYIQLTEVEAAFKNLKDDLALRPIYHQSEHRIEAHIFISFLAYCLLLEKFGTVQMLDVHLPTTDKRTVILSRYTQPETDVQLLLHRMMLELPPQPPPQITGSKPPGQTDL